MSNSSLSYSSGMRYDEKITMANGTDEDCVGSGRCLSFLITVYFNLRNLPDYIATVTRHWSAVAASLLAAKS